MDSLRHFYGEKIRSLKLKSDGFLVEYIDQFQGLAIIWQEICQSIESKYRLVTQMVEQIEDYIFSGPCKCINKWDTHRHRFCDSAATLQAHEISKMTTQTKMAINDAVNSLLLGKG